jgi:hypothetical protein
MSDGKLATVKRPSDAFDGQETCRTLNTTKFSTLVMIKNLFLHFRPNMAYFCNHRAKSYAVEGYH